MSPIILLDSHLTTHLLGDIILTITGTRPITHPTIIRDGLIALLTTQTSIIVTA
jgi:hypothetical protein